MAEDEMVGTHYQLNGYEFEQTPGDSERKPGAAVHRIAKSWTRLSEQHNRMDEQGTITRLLRWLKTKSCAFT